MQEAKRVQFSVAAEMNHALEVTFTLYGTFVWGNFNMANSGALRYGSGLYGTKKCIIYFK